MTAAANVSLSKTYLFPKRLGISFPAQRFHGIFHGFGLLLGAAAHADQSVN